MSMQQFTPGFYSNLCPWLYPLEIQPSLPDIDKQVSDVISVF